MIKKYGKFFWVLPLLMSIRELYQILSKTNGDILDLFMFIGFIDDLLKIKYENSRGLNLKLKFLGQLVISLIAILILLKYSDHQDLINP